MNKIKYLIPAVALMFGLASCGNMDELYKDYKKDYSIYPSPVSGVTAQSGYERAILKWTLPETELVKGVKLTYNNGENEIVFNERVDSCAVTGLPSGNFDFEVRSLDAWGNESLPRTTSVKVYGDQDTKILSHPTISISVDSDYTHILKLANVSGTSSMWGGKLVVTITAPDGTTETVDLSQTFDPFATGSTTTSKGTVISGYYSRAIDLVVDLGLTLQEGTYKVDYEMSAYPTNFKNKANGIYFYNKICVDALTIEDSTEVVVAAVEVPEPEEPETETETEETPAE